MKTPSMAGKYTFGEAGDSVTFDEFDAFFHSSCDYLGNGQDLYVHSDPYTPWVPYPHFSMPCHAPLTHVFLCSNHYSHPLPPRFVEDAALGTVGATRVGTRVVTDNAAVALVARALLVATPPRPCDHRAKYNGWNLDARWGIADSVMEWTGSAYENVATPGVKQAGQRPVTALVGTSGAASAAGVQFVSSDDDEIVGANVVVSGAAPMQALVEGLVVGGTTVVNDASSDAVALPSIALTSGKLVVFGEGVAFSAVQEAVEKALAAKTLFGAYANIVTADGVSPMFGGAIGSAKLAGADGLVISSGGLAAVPINPDNLMALPKEVVVVSGSGGKGEEVLTALTSDDKAGVIGTILKGAKVTVVKDVASAF